MSYSFKNYIEENYMSVLVSAVKSYIDLDNYNNCAVKIENISICDIDYRPLFRMSDTVILPTVFMISFQSYEDGETYCKNFFLSGKIKGTFSRDFSDISVVCLRAFYCSPQKYPVLFTDDLIPTFGNIEQDTIRMLHAIYPTAETSPCRIEPTWIAQELGITVRYEKISDDDSVLGQYFFRDSTALLYNDKMGIHVPTEIKARTIVISKTLLKNKILLRFTLMHELIHAYLQFYALELIRMCNKDADHYFCPVRTDSSSQFVDPFIEKMERYADMAASAALMPSTPFKRLTAKFYAEQGKNIDADTLQRILLTTSEFYGVSIAACRRRFIRLGFSEMRGICCYIDKGYVPSYRYRPDALEKDQTYTVSDEQSKRLIHATKKLMKMVARGLVCYIEHHFILNSPMYINADKRLTYYARNHMDECAIKFEIQYPNGYYTKARLNITQDGFYRTEASLMPITIFYSEDNIHTEESAKALYERNKDVTAIAKKINGDFADSFAMVIAWSEMSHDEIAYSSWVTCRNINKLIQEGSEIKPTMQVVIRLCVGMHLPFEISYKLLIAAGYTLGSSMIDTLYIQILMFAQTITIEDCNVIMKKHGLPPLGKKNPTE